MSEGKCIIDRLNELEMEAQFKVDTMKRLKEAWHVGYRLVDEDDIPITGVDNVVNIHDYRVKGVV